MTDARSLDLSAALDYLAPKRIQRDIYEELHSRQHTGNPAQPTPPGTKRWVYFEAGRWWSVTEESLIRFGQSLREAYAAWASNDPTGVEVETAASRYGGKS